jgi:hypothetical protein
MNRSLLTGMLIFIAAGSAGCGDDKLPSHPDAGGLAADAAVPIADAAIPVIDSAGPASDVAADVAQGDVAQGDSAQGDSAKADGGHPFDAGSPESQVAEAGTGPTFRVTATFTEPMTKPNDSIFTGTFTFDAQTKTVTGLTGTLTQSMTKVNGAYGGPMTTVALTHQLSSVPVSLDGADGLLVTTFALATTDTFTGGGFAPGGTQYFGLNEGTPNNHNAYVTIFVNTADPTAVLTQGQLDKLAYADCTDGGMMMKTCMTGTTVAGYGRKGTMAGYPSAQVISAP